MKKANGNTAISVVVPLFNEVDNVGLLYEAVRKVLISVGKSFEMIFVDDGSTDGTREVLRRLAQQDRNLRVVLFRRNFGQSAAMAAGFKISRGATVVAMDGDLQNDARDIPGLLEKMDEGYDVVSGWRKNRKDTLILRKIPSRIANWMITSVTDVRLHDTGCSLKAFRREVIQKIRLYGELHRFIPALARVEGARISEMAVTHHPRRFGKSKYNLTRTFRVLMDLTSLNLFIKYLRNPFRFFGQVAVWVFLLALFFTVWVGYQIIIRGIDPYDMNVLITLVFLLWVAGGQLVFFGLVANIIVSTGERRGISLADIDGYHQEDKRHDRT